MKKLSLTFVLALGIVLAFMGCKRTQKVLTVEVLPTEDKSQFVNITDVVPDAILEIRYYSTYNFVGARVDGYEQPMALMTRQAADSLKVVSDELREQGYRIKELDMGSPFDWFGIESHPDYMDLTEEQIANRHILWDAMFGHGFKGIDSEWWHFTLKDEPFPDTYFTFPVKQL